MKNSRCKVVIVGGGIGGLALANSLQHADIDYVMIEKGEELDPQVGAAIGILPNGARILDQINCYDDLANMTVDMESTASHKADGSLIGDVSDSLKLMQQRTGYGVIFIDRQLLLRVLAEHITDYSRIRLKTSVKSIEQHDDKAVVHCANGDTIDADIVVGSDGVHSLVRREMWRHADLAGQGAKFEEDKKAMSAEYKCLFGISTNVEGMSPGQTDRTFAHGVSTLSYVGKEGRVSWFVFIKMDKVYYPPDIPRFTDDDVPAAIEEVGSLPLEEDSRITVSDLYKSRVCCNLVAIEEAEYQHWSYNRLVCMGDSIHKMTPNLGAGASSAMESATVLSNAIVRLASGSEKPSLSDINEALDEYQRSRTIRVTKAMRITNKLTRVQALETTRDYLLTHYIGPRMDDYYAEMFSSFVIGVPTIEHLPIPPRSLQGTMPFNSKQGWGFEESLSARAKRAWPLMAMALLSLLTATTSLSWSTRNSRSKLYGQKSFFTSTQGRSSAQPDLTFSLQSDAMYGLWLIESTRLNNKGTFAQIPILFGLAAHFLGTGVGVPLYLFFLYVQSPIEKFRALDARLTDVSYTYSVGPLIVLCAFFKAVLQQSRSVDSFWNRIMGLQPLLLSISQIVIARLFRPSTIRSDRINNIQRDVMGIRYATGILAILSSVSWYYNPIVLGQAMPWTHLFTPTGASEQEICLTLGVVVWLVLAFRDLRDAGMTESSWSKIFSCGAVALGCLGPAATLLLGWQWREEILLSRRHRDAVVKQ